MFAAVFAALWWLSLMILAVAGARLISGIALMAAFLIGEALAARAESAAHAPRISAISSSSPSAPVVSASSRKSADSVRLAA